MAKKDYKKLKGIFYNDPDVLRSLEVEENNELLRDIVASSKETKPIVIEGVSQLKGDQGEKGEDGYTPIKGEDYFTDTEVSQIIEIAAEKATPVKGRDYFDGEKGRNADESKIVAKLSKLIPTSEEIASQVKLPEIDEEKIARNILKKIPKGEPVPTIEEIIKELKKGRWLEKRDIKDMPLNMKDLRWHGGGISSIIAGTGITVSDDGSGHITVSQTSAADGDVHGPASSTDMGVALFDGTTGKLLKNSSSFVQLANGNVGIGTVNPLLKLTVNANASGSTNLTTNWTVNTADIHIIGADNLNTGIMFESYNLASQFIGLRANGTFALPTAVQANNVLFNLAASGYATTGFAGGSRVGVRMYASENWTDTAQGTHITFATTLNGTTSRVDRLTMNNAGNVGIGTTGPSEKLDVSGALRVSGARAGNSGNAGFLDFSSSDMRFLSQGPDNSTRGSMSFTVRALDASASLLSLQLTNTGNVIMVQGSGNVGIGTTGPTSPLHLFQVLHSAPLTFHIENDGYLEGASAQLLLSAKGTGGNSEDAAILNDVDGSTDGSRLLFQTGYRTSPTTKMVIDNLGNVGIGTTSPASVLHVQGSGINSGGGIIVDTGITAKSSYQSLNVSGALISIFGSNVYSDGTLATQRYDTSKKGWDFIMDNRAGYDQFALKSISAAGTLSNRFKVYDTGAVALGGNIVDGSAVTGASMVIDNSGNVGIGTTDPVGQLSLNNQISSSLLTYAGTHLFGQAIFNSYYTSATNGSSGTYPRFLDIASVGYPDGTNGGGVIRFLTNPITNASSAVERMRINDNGNVGIGTTSPAQLLNVYGTTNPTIQVDNGTIKTWLQADTADNAGFVGTRSANNFAIGTNGAFNMFIQQSSGNVGIGTTSPNANALLDITSTTKAFMPPRATTTQIAAVASPTEGMVMFDTTLHKLSYYNGTAWLVV